MDMAAEATPTPPTTSGRDGLAARDSLRGAAGAAKLSRMAASPAGAATPSPTTASPAGAATPSPAAATPGALNGAIEDAAAGAACSLHANEACSQLACGEQDGRVQIEIHGSGGGPTLLGLHQAVEITLSPTGVPRGPAQHQLSLSRRSAATERRAR
jgi:hypothetical protein